MFEHFRVRVVKSRIRGTLLDVGAWTNRWAEEVGGHSVNYITEAPSEECYNTITMLAVLNYITPQDIPTVIEGCHARLKRYGRLLITCINPIGSLGLPKQPKGLRRQEVIALVEAGGFKLVYDKPFMLGLNRLYVFGKEIGKDTLAPKEYRKEVEQLKKEL